MSDSRKISDESRKRIEDILKEDLKDEASKTLDEKLRRTILEKLEIDFENEPYAILDLELTASSGDIKARYHELSKEFHPDRFFKKNLGHYQRKLETLFSRIQKAYMKLKDPIEREAYNRLHAIKTKTSMAPASVPKTKRLSLEMQRWGKAEQLFKKGLEHEKNKEYIEAYHAFIDALKIEPKRDVIKAAHQRIQPLAFQKMSEKQFEEVKSMIKMTGYSSEITRKLEEIQRANSQSIEIQGLLGVAIVETKKESKYREAREYLNRAKTSFPNDAEYCFALGKLFDLLGDRKLAQKELKEALKRNPSHQAAKTYLSNL